LGWLCRCEARQERPQGKQAVLLLLLVVVVVLLLLPPPLLLLQYRLSLSSHIHAAHQ